MAPSGHAVLRHISVIAMVLGGGLGLAIGTWRQRDGEMASAPTLQGNGSRRPRGMMWIPGGEFFMGSDYHLAKRVWTGPFKAHRLIGLGLTASRAFLVLITGFRGG
jgi:hypothetical protein